MKWLRRSARAVAAASTLGAFALGWSVVALAQDETSEQPSPLEAVVDVRSEGNDAAAASQKRIDAISDETDDLVAQYRTVLKQIDSIKLYNGQMRELISAQEEEITSLEDQLERVQGVSRSVTPLMLRMVDAIEQFVKLDVPFLIDERVKRVEGLRKMMSRSDVTTPEKFRQIMEAYQIENEFGRTIEAYRATLTIDDRETTVDFLRFGRIALLYQSLDETQSGRWDQQTRSWVPLDSSYRSAIRQGLRIARKQSAPDMIRLPLPAPVDARGSS
jgi:septal ring factor EnvC (AmiA/AmiB activator)